MDGIQVEEPSIISTRKQQPVNGFGPENKLKPLDNISFVNRRKKDEK